MGYMTMRSLFQFEAIMTAAFVRFSSAADFLVSLPANTNTLRLAFASCHDFPTDAYAVDGPGNAMSGPPFNWTLVHERRPDAMVWVGDIIYGDFPRKYGFVPPPLSYVLPEIPTHLPPFVAGDSEKLRTMYKGLRKDPGYAALLRSLGSPKRHLGTWDDHDYSINDGDRTLPSRMEAKQAFLEFFDAPPDDPRRERDGVYASTIFQSEGKASRSVLIVALDMRFSKDPYTKSGRGDFLGAAQWAWLRSTLAEHQDVTATVFVSSLQLLPLGRELVSECWANFPESRSRFLELLQTVRAPLVVSGDVHFAELLAATCDNYVQASEGSSATKVEGMLVELTTSGLTHSWGEGMGMLTPELRRCMAWIMWAFQHFLPWTFQTRSGTGWAQVPDFFLNRNFGEIEFDFNRTVATTRVMDGFSGGVVIEKEWSLASLLSKKERGSGNGNGKASAKCEPHRGTPSKLRVAAGLAGMVVFTLCIILLKPTLAVVAVLLLRRCFPQANTKAKETKNHGKGNKKSKAL